MNNGFYAVGDFNRLESSPWTNNPERFNHRIVLNRPYEDRYGNPQVDVHLIDISAQDLARLQNDQSKFQGKKVIIPVVPQARQGGRNGAFLSVRMPNDSQIQTIKDPQ